MMNEPVHSIMSTNLITVTPTTSLVEVREIFMNHKIHHIPVVEDKKLVGILTTYNLWLKEIKPEEYSHKTAGEYMSRKVVKVQQSDKIGTAAELFLDNRFHALPVVDDQNLVGLVTSFDVLRYNFRKEYPNPILYKEVFKE